MTFQSGRGSFAGAVPVTICGDFTASGALVGTLFAVAIGAMPCPVFVAALAFVGVPASNWRGVISKAFRRAARSSAALRLLSSNCDLRITENSRSLASWARSSTSISRRSLSALFCLTVRVSDCPISCVRLSALCVRVSADFSVFTLNSLSDCVSACPTVRVRLSATVSVCPRPSVRLSATN